MMAEPHLMHDLIYYDYDCHGICPSSVEVTGWHPLHSNRLVFACLNPFISRPQLKREIGWPDYHPHVKRCPPKCRLHAIPMSIFQFLIHTISGDIKIANPLSPFVPQIVGELVRWKSRHDDAYSPGIVFSAWIHFKLELLGQSSAWNWVTLNCQEEELVVFSNQNC